MHLPCLSTVSSLCLSLATFKPLRFGSLARPGGRRAVVARMRETYFFYRWLSLTLCLSSHLFPIPFSFFLFRTLQPMLSSLLSRQNYSYVLLPPFFPYNIKGKKKESVEVRENWGRGKATNTRTCFHGRVIVLTERKENLGMFNCIEDYY